MTAENCCRRSDVVAQRPVSSRRLVQSCPKVCLSSDLASPPGGPYSQIVLHEGLAYLAGCTPHAPGSGELVAGGFDKQARRAFENLQALAVTAGTDLSNTLKVTVYLRDMANFQAMKRRQRAVERREKKKKERKQKKKKKKKKKKSTVVTR